MNGRTAKKIRKLLSPKPDMNTLVIIHNHYGEKTKNMDFRQVYQATKKLYKEGHLKLN